MCTKTDEEIQKANKREEEIKAAKEEADNVAHLEFSKATEKAFGDYIAVWEPARKKWEKFQEPFFDVLHVKLAANSKTEGDALAEVRGNWRVCPKCGLPASRYQTFCSGRKCETNLLLGGKQSDNDNS